MKAKFVGWIQCKWYKFKKQNQAKPWSTFSSLLWSLFTFINWLFWNLMSVLCVWVWSWAAGQNHLQALSWELTICICVDWYATFLINLPTDPGQKSRHSRCVVPVSALAFLCMRGGNLCAYVVFLPIQLQAALLEWWLLLLPGSCQNTVLEKKWIQKRKTATWDVVNITWGKEKDFRYHRLCPWTVRFMEEWLNLPEARAMASLVLALSGSDWDNCFYPLASLGSYRLASWWCSWDKILCMQVKLSGFNYFFPHQLNVILIFHWNRLIWFSKIDICLIPVVYFFSNINFFFFFF